MCIIMVFLKCFKLNGVMILIYLIVKVSWLNSSAFAAANSSIARTMDRRLKTIGLMRKHATKN